MILAVAGLKLLAVAAASQPALFDYEARIAILTKFHRVSAWFDSYGDVAPFREIAESSNATRTL